MTSTGLRLLACQIAIPAMTTAHKRDAHLAASAERVSGALMRTPADLVVLPELSGIDYSRAAFDNLADLAEPLDGPSFACWRKLAIKHNCHVAYGFARKDGTNYFITHAVVSPGGSLLGHYDKIHLAHYGASMEKDYFRRGSQVFVFTLNGFTIAPIICYDIRFPELSRRLVIRNKVDLILHCGAYYRDESFASWHAFATTRALENQVFFLSLNRAGAKYGNSLFCWPWMDETRTPVCFPKHDESLCHIDIDRKQLMSARRSFSFLADRLPDYGALKLMQHKRD